MIGVELLLFVTGSLSMAQASTGFDNAMRIEGWIYFWRIVLGFGVGADIQSQLSLPQVSNLLCNI
jgi:hypothetical protein